MLKRVLIVDDNALNRLILEKMLSRDYYVLQAASGEDALETLTGAREPISAVLLDIVMPGMDGYEVLRRIRDNAALMHIPVIMITGSDDDEALNRSLSMGANDFVMKPYKPDIIRHCLETNIALHETSATLMALRRDRITGLYNREPFFELVGEMVHAHEPGYYVMACFDVDNFKIVNDQYGTAKGDAVLRHVGEVFKQGFDPIGGLCSRIFADNFAVPYPASFQSSPELEQIRLRSTRVEGLITPIIFSIGRYAVDDLSLAPSAMYDRASLAADSVKGRYDNKIAQYSEAMREGLLREQEIVQEMSAALEAGQFEVWFQPQYNYASHALIGAEALVRWRHPTKGLVPPGVFIPIFEKNGFVYSLDQYVWRETCRQLRAWIDEGKDPLPISVNVSRYDILRPDVVQTIRALMEEFAIPAELLRLEVTESAFSESSQRMIEVVKALIDDGFTVEIDDFGSGYSSLNTLKDVPAQIIKLDMRFLERGNDSQRGGNIIESVVRMAKWLGMAVIAEGVESVEQANYLRSIGCSYMQGYLFARPMPTDDYERHCADTEKEGRLLTLETVEGLNNNAFWDPDSIDTLIFNSYIGGACIFEYHDGRIELLRATKKYAQVIGSAGMTVEEALKLDWMEHLDGEQRDRVAADIRRSIESKEEVTDEYVFLDLPGCPKETYLRSTLRVIAAAGDRYLIYCTNENITAQRQSEKATRALAEQFQSIMDNVDAGIVATVIDHGLLRFLFANQRYYEMRGYTKEQFERERPDPHAVIVEEQRQGVREKTLEITRTGESVVMEYEIVRRDGERRYIRNAISIGHFDGIETPVQLSIFRDITEERRADLRERGVREQLSAIMRDIDSGLTATVRRGDAVEVLFSNEQFYRMRGYTHEQYHAEVADHYALVHPDERERVRKASDAAYSSGESVRDEYRILMRDGAERWLRVSMTVTRFTGVDQPVLLSVYSDVTAEKNAEMATRDAMTQMRNIMDDIPGGFCRIQMMPDGGLIPVYINDGLSRLTGMSHDELIALYGRDARAGVHPDDIPIVSEAVDRMLKEGEARSARYRLRRKPDGYIWLSIFGRVTQDLQGHTFLNIYYIDATKQMEDEEKQRALLDNLPSGVGVYAMRDGQMELVYQNKSYWALVGLDEAAFPDPAPMSAIHPDDVPTVMRELALSMQQGRDVSCDIRLRHLTLGYRPVHLAGRVVPEGEGGATIFATFTPISCENA